MFPNTPVGSQQIVAKQISLYDGPESEKFLEFENGGKLYDYFIKADKNERFMEEVLDCRTTACRPFVTVRYERMAQNVTSNAIKTLFGLFKQHLVDCGALNAVEQVLALWAVDMSTNSEIIIRYVFDCGEFYFKSLEVLQECLTLFKQRIFSDKKNEALVPLLTFVDHSNAAMLRKLIIETELLDARVFQKSERLVFRVRLFGHPNDRNVGFLSGVTGSRFVYMKDSDLQLEDIDSLNAKNFALSKEEFRHLLLSDITAHTNANKKPPKLISSLNKMALSRSLSNTASSLSRYYAKEYPFETVWKLFGDPCREVNYVFITNGNPFWKRSMSFKSVDQFKQSVMENLPQVIHFGAIYDRVPSDPLRVVVKKELIFDIDLNDYHLTKEAVGRPGEFNVRMCCGSEKKACSKCWTLIRFGARFLYLMLTKMLGFDPNDLRFVFSGRRGMHCIVFDDRAREFTEKQRQDLLNFFSRESAKHLEYPIVNELYETVALPLLKTFLSMHPESLKTSFYEHIEENKRRRIPYPEATPTLMLFWPRFDQKMTTQLVHPFKGPYSLHPETHNICEFFDPQSDYDPFLVLQK